MLTFAANLSTMFGHLPFIDRFAAAADAGFRFVECQFPYDHPPERLAERLRSCGLKMVLLNAPRGEGAEMGLAALPRDRARFRRSLDEATTYALMLQVPCVHILSGLRTGDREQRSAWIDAMREAADRFALHATTVLVEPLNVIDYPNYFLTGFTQAREFVGATERDNVKLLFDTYHCRMNGGSLATEYAAAAKVIGHIQVSSVPDRSGPDAADIAFLNALDGRQETLIGCEYRSGSETVAELGWMAGLSNRPVSHTG